MANVLTPAEVRCREIHYRQFADMFSPIDREARRAVLALIRRGVLTPGEAAKLAGVSVDVVYAWCKRERVNWRRVRAKRLTELWRKEVRSGRGLADRGAVREDDA